MSKDKVGHEAKKPKAEHNKKHRGVPPQTPSPLDAIRPKVELKRAT